jgi:nucleotide-binding universal stress UspA family protein
MTMSSQSTPSKRIVVGVDGSPASVDALRWAARQAELTQSSVQALITWQVPNQYGDDFYGQQIDWADIAQRALETALTEAGDGTPFGGDQVVFQGHPARSLVDVSHDAELLVVGSRGHGGFAGLLLGSVSSYVVAHANCPVVVIRHREIQT